MTYTRFLILEWIGRWTLPDHHHGGIDPGPFSLKSEAEKTIENFAQKEYDSCLREPYGQDLARAEEARADILRRHTIIQVSWPENLSVSA